VASLIGWGLQRHAKGDQNVRFINALAFASGNVGREGGGAYFSQPSLRNLNPEVVRAATASSRFFSLPRMAAELEGARPPVELIWMAGLNLANQVPDSLAVARALKKIPFKVVVEAFPTDTVDLADLVLPCALMLEKEDLAVSWGHDFVNHSAQVLDPPGQARSDFQIAGALAARLGKSFPGLEEFLERALESPWLETNLSRIRQAGFARVKRPRVAFAGGVFAHPDGLCRLPDKLDPEPEPEPGYPLRLLSLIRREATHSQILPEDQGGEPPRAWVSPDSPGLAGLDLARPVFLASPLGRLRVGLETMDGLHPEAVVFRRGGWQKYGGGINQLIRARNTELGGIAAFYQQSVRLEN
jgi:anaerobic selenocysteine-containing dehydrogenase